MNTLFKPQTIYTVTLVSVVIAVTLLLIQACGGGGGEVGNSFAASAAKPNNLPGPVGVRKATAFRQDCAGASALPADGSGPARGTQVVAPAGNVVSLPCATDAGSPAIQ